MKQQPQWFHDTLCEMGASDPNYPAPILYVKDLKIIGVDYPDSYSFGTLKVFNRTCDYNMGISKPNYPMPALNDRSNPQWWKVIWYGLSFLV